MEETSTLPCAFCPKKFKNTAFLMKHESKCMVKKKFGCSYCNKKFPDKKRAKKHEKTHSKNPKKTPTKNSEKSPILAKSDESPSDTAEKIHGCKFCPKKFISKNRAENHERIHTGEKPFSCQYCGKAFSQSGNAKIHERYGNFSCCVWKY